MLGSQSPYGAMWSATRVDRDSYRGRSRPVAIPLRGYVVCNEGVRGYSAHLVVLSQSPYGAMWSATVQSGAPCPGAKDGVAIPLRGYVVCNSTPLRMPFWTAPPEGVFVRKMKLGICMGRIAGVFGGLRQ